MRRIVNFVKSHIVIIVLLQLTLVLIAPFLGHDYKISFGEGPFMLNPDYQNYLYIWQNRINLGTLFLTQTLFFWFKVIWKLPTPFSPIISPSLFFIFIGGYFFAGLFLYYCLKTLFGFKDNFLYIPPVLLYTFNIFRVIGTNSDEMTILWISLPIFFLLYYRLVNTLKWRYVFLLVITSLLTSTMGKNLAVFLLPYILMMFYFLFYVLFVRIDRSKFFAFLIRHLVLIILMLLANLYWVVPQYFLLQSYYFASDRGKNLWSVLGSGSFFDHFRFMGFWAFRDASYYPYTNLYYQPLLLFTTFFTSIFSFFYFFFLKDKKAFYLKIFFTALSIISFLLVSGNKGVTGIFYQYVYDHISVLKMYRDSYSKFTPLYVFALSGGLLLSLSYFQDFIKNRLLQITLILYLSSIIVLNAWPLFKFTYEITPSRPGTVSTIVQIPQYWKDLDNYLSTHKLNEWLFVFQNNGYGTNSIWEHGVNVVGNIAEFILKAKVIRSYSLDLSDAQQVINNLFKNNYAIKNLKAYLGLLNSRFILQENDTEWRYGNIVQPPSQSNAIILKKGFTKVREFGKFTPDYLNRIYDTAPSPILRRQLSDELINQPALVLYKMEDDYFIPMFYTPKHIMVSVKRVNDLDDIVSQSDYVIPSATFFTRQNATVYAQAYLQNIKANGIDVLNRPIIEYKEINPTKYRLIVHDAKTSFPLIFSSNYSSEWRIFFVNYKRTPVSLDKIEHQAHSPQYDDQATISESRNYVNNGWISFVLDTPQFISHNFKNTIQNDNLPDGTLYETWFSKPYDDKTHMTANGFANAWILDPNEICRTNSCVSKPDGTYDFEIVLEYSLQKYLWIGYGIAFFILFVSTIFVLFDLAKQYAKRI